MIKLELSEQMIAVIGNALGAAPYNIAAPVIVELQRQIDAQRPKTNGGIPTGIIEDVAPLK